MAYEYLGSPLKCESIKFDPCFFGNISREAGETLLEQRANCEGTYLVREGSDGFRLSVVDKMRSGNFEVVHYKVQMNCNKAYSIDPACSFTTMTSLITYYKGKCTNMKTPLTVPCSHSDQPEKNEENLHGSPSDAQFLSLHEINKPDITFKTQISVGKYAEIWKASYQTEGNVVAVKVSNDENNSEWYLMEEARALATLKHRNIIQFIGMSRDHSVHLVCEHCGNKDLLDFLLRGDTYELSRHDRLRIAQEVCDALLHISKLNYVHRNIKACNIFITDNCSTKVSGFGYVAKLKEGIYVENSTDKSYNPNSIRWMALEAAESRKFSTASDVWAFACLMIELFTDGEAPFSGTLTPNILKIIKDGYRPPRPSFLPESFYSVMVKCWNPIPGSRPGFVEIQENLQEVRHPSTPTYKQKETRPVMRNHSAITSSSHQAKTANCPPERSKSSKSFTRFIGSVMRKK